MSNYKFKDGFRSKVNPQKFGEALDNIESLNDGVVTAKNVVNYARNDGSSIHNMCSWNDAEEAELHRENVARRHIRQTIEIIPHDEKSATNDSTKKDIQISERVNNPVVSGYQKIEIVAADSESYTACIEAIDKNVAALNKSIKALEASARLNMNDNDVGIIALHEAFRCVDKAMDMLRN